MFAVLFIIFALVSLDICKESIKRLVTIIIQIVRLSCNLGNIIQHLTEFADYGYELNIASFCGAAFMGYECLNVDIVTCDHAGICSMSF